MSFYCEKCGHELKDDVKFCSNCGTEAKETNKSTIKKGFRWNKIKVTILIICVISVIIGGGLFYNFYSVDTSYPFNLNSSQINNAIDFGKKVSSTMYSTSAEEMKKTSDQYLKNEMVYENNEGTSNITNVILINPYNSIVTNASKSDSDYSVSSAMEDIKSMVNDESFQLYITTSDGNINSVTLKQGNTTIKPFNSDRINDTEYSVEFSNKKDMDKINYKDKADLIIDGSKISTINFNDFIIK